MNENLSLFLPSKKISWALLTLLFTFDNFLSYFAISYFGGREANLAIAYWVEKYPLLYFLCIPLTIFIMYIIFRILLKIALWIFKKREVKKVLIERIILGSMVIYWAVANSSLNIAFLIGHRQPASMWALTSAAGILLALSYFFFAKFYSE